MNIYVGNLPYKIRNEQLRDAFEEFGEVVSAEVIVDRRSNRSKGYGFVRMDTESDAMAAIESLHRSDFYGRELRVQLANTGDKSKERGNRHRSSRGKQANKDSLITRFFKNLFGK